MQELFAEFLANYLALRLALGRFGEEISESNPMNEPKTNEEKRGRPINLYRAAEKIIGTAGVTALSEADLYIVDGDTIRKLSGIVKEKAEAAT